MIFFGTKTALEVSRVIVRRLRLLWRVKLAVEKAKIGGNCFEMSHFVCVLGAYVPKHRNALSFLQRRGCFADK